VRRGGLLAVEGPPGGLGWEGVSEAGLRWSVSRRDFWTCGAAAFFASGRGRVQKR